MQNHHKIPSKTKTPKKKAVQVKKEVATKQRKGDDKIWVKSRNLAYSLKARTKAELHDTIPTKEEIYKWLSHAKYICTYCEAELGEDNIQIDHIVPLKRNGSNQLSNLCVSCDDCNRAKGELFENEYRQLLEMLKTWDTVSATNFFKRIRMGHFGR